MDSVLGVYIASLNPAQRLEEQARLLGVLKIKEMKMHDTRQRQAMTQAIDVVRNAFIKSNNIEGS
jgi:hypothetical protein